MIEDLIRRTRSFRRFDESVNIDLETLEGLIELARNSASARNRQPLKYIPVNEPGTVAGIFPTLTFAAALKDWAGPAEGERPAAYIIVLGDTQLATSFGYDCGIACQNIMLGARERELGGCMIASINKSQLRELLGIPMRYEILLVLALGKPAETVVIEPMPPDGSVAYWHDGHGIHHVPKRSLEEIIIRPDRNQDPFLRIEAP